VTRYRVSIDIGGTFTDVVAYDEETAAYSAGKSSTTPSDLTEGVLAGLGQIVASSEDIAFAVHGTTQGLNAFLQRRGERVLLLSTAGAGDVYHIARGHRSKLYDLHFRKPEPLVPRRDIVEIRGRLNYAGAERAPLHESDVRVAARRFAGEGFQSIAVAYLFSYLNPDHELRTRQILQEELGADTTVVLSHEVAREWREYERTSSTVLDAYTAPIVRRYLQRLETELRDRGLSATLHVMQSSGGVVTAASARKQAVQTLLSGPVGGTMGGVALSRLLETPNLICVDMGGTSFDVSLVVDGKPDVSTEAELEGFPILMPVVNIHTIGAGGGSLAYAEAAGLRVGPQSAGADPGPACYGRGGTQPTVTDANLVLGRVDPEWFAGGTLSLDAAAAEKAVAGLGQQLGLAMEELAEGVCDVVNAKMAQAIRTLTVKNGIAPHDFSLVAFGGAGGMHAVFLARELDIAEVIVPPFPGAFSAWGMLETELRQDFSQSAYSPLATADKQQLASDLQAMEAEGLEGLGREGIPPTARRFEHAVDVRYIGQEYTLTVPIRSRTEPTEDGFDEALAERFDRAHETRFGHSNPGAPIELVTLRTAAFGDLGRPRPKPVEPVDGGAPTTETRNVVFGGEALPTTIARRANLQVGAVLDGPAIVLEDTATTVLPPRSQLRVDPFGALVITTDKDR
jgi:N-methylhydantoinase A